MSKTLVIAFLGCAGSGKTTAAKYLVEKYNFKKISFAEPIKKLAKHVMSFSDDQLYGTIEEKEEVDSRYGMSPIEFLQSLGEGARKEINEDIWTNVALDRIISSGEKLVVIDDCRYISEVESLFNDKRIISVIIKLICLDSTSNRDKNHPSESQVNQVPNDLLYEIIISKISPMSKDLLDKVDNVLNDVFRCFKII